MSQPSGAVAGCSYGPRAQIRDLLEHAEDVHPDPTYLDRIDPRHFDHRYREKVVKYTNEVSFHGPRRIDLRHPTLRNPTFTRSIGSLYPQLAEDFGLQAHTAGIACNYFDRFIPLVLAQRPVGRQEIQVIASTCLLIAAKFSDRKLPPLSELAVVHEHTVEPHIFADQEAAILEVLEWKLHVRLPETFVEPLRRCLRDAPVDAAIRERMQFFIDLSVYGERSPRGSHEPSAECQKGATAISSTSLPPHQFPPSSPCRVLLARSPAPRRPSESLSACLASPCPQAMGSFDTRRPR